MHRDQSDTQEGWDLTDALEVLAALARAVKDRDEARDALQSATAKLAAAKKRAKETQWRLETAVRRAEQVRQRIEGHAQEDKRDGC